MICRPTGSEDSEELTFPDIPPGEYTAIAARYAFYGWAEETLTVCALVGTEEAVCWRTTRVHASPYPLSTWSLEGHYTSVAVSGSDFCGLRVTGAIEGCGLPKDDGAPHYVAVSPGENHVCAVTDAGHLECWTHGSGWFGQGEVFVMKPPASSSRRYVTVSMGRGYGCALSEAGEVACWGSTINKVVPPDPPPGRYVAVGDGLGHTCALTEDGQIACWGWNTYGQVLVPEGRYTAISAGNVSTCALTAGGGAVCWGFTSLGRFPASDRYVDVSAGDWGEACALSEAGEAVCSMGIGEAPSGPFVATGLRGYGRTCALAENGEAVCWIKGGDGQASSSAYAHATVTLHSAAIAGRTSFDCVTTASGDVECEGMEGFGPLDLPAGRYVAISDGGLHGCALTEAGDVRCWGLFTESRKDGTGYGPAPQPPGRYKAISSSMFRTCAVTVAGEVVCWGDVDFDEPPLIPPY